MNSIPIITLEQIFEIDPDYIQFHHQIDQPLPNVFTRKIDISTLFLNRPYQIQSNSHMSPNALGGPSTNRALTLNHFYYPDPEEYNSIDPILIQDVKRSIYQAQLINFFFLALGITKLALIILVYYIEIQELTLGAVYLFSQFLYELAYFSHNTSLIIMLPRTPFHAFFIEYNSNDSEDEDINISGCAISSFWQKIQKINGLTIMIKCEKYYKNIHYVGEILRVLYYIIFLYGNLIFFAGVYADNSQLLLQPLFLGFLIMGYVYHIFPLLFCFTGPCILGYLFCNYLFTNRFDRIQQQQYFENQVPLRESVLQKIRFKEYITLSDSERQDICSICFQDFTDSSHQILQLPCNENHYFHQNCCNQWLEINRTCPICRKNVEKMILEQDQ